MKPIDQAILQQNIIDAINALFLSGQVGKVETKKTIIMEEQPLTADPENGYSALQIEYNVPVKLGKKYTVHLDSGSYIAELREFPGVGGYLGNGSLVGDLEDTGESYCVFCMIEEGTVFTIAVDTNSGKKISITETTETIHPIDPKFIPAETPDAEILESYQTFTKHYVAEGEAPDNVQWKEYYDPVMVFIDTEIPADGTHVSLSGLDVAKLEQLQTAPVPICFTMDNGYSHTVMPVFTVVLADVFMSYSCQYALTSRVIFQRNPNGTWEAYKQ